MQQIELLDLLKRGVHFGHRASKWHPNMRSFIFGEKGGIHIIDLERTREKLEEAYNLVRDNTAKGKTILIIGTKRQAYTIINEVAADAEIPYVNERWIGGLLTNYGVVSKMAKKLTKLKKQKEIGEWSKYTKKEALMLERQVEKLQRDLGGIETMDRVPDMVFITDMKHDATAVREAQRKGLTIIAIADTNVDPLNATVAIPANDDAVKSIEFITQMIGEAVKEGRKLAASMPKPEAKGAKKPDAKKPEAKKEAKPVEKKAEKPAVEAKNAKPEEVKAEKAAPATKPTA